MKLTKDTLIEGTIVKAGTEVRILLEKGSYDKALKLTMEKKVIVHRANMSVGITYANLKSALEGENLIAVKCISEYMTRRIKNLEDLGFKTIEIIVPISKQDGLAFAEYLMSR